MIQLRKIFLIVIALATLTACASAQPGEALTPAMTFKNLEPLNLAVRDRAINAVHPINAEGFSYALDDLMSVYLQRKLHPVGTQGAISANIDQVEVHRTQEEAESGVANFLNVGGFEVYTVKIKLRLEHLDNAYEPVYGKVLNINRRIKISEHASIAEREQTQFESLEKLFVDLDQRINKILLEEMKLGVTN